MSYFSEVTTPGFSSRNRFMSQYIWVIGALLSFLGMWVVFSNFLPTVQALTRAVVAFTFFFTVAFANLKWLIPNFFSKQQLVKYSIMTIITCLVITLLRYFLEEKLSIPVSLIRRGAFIDRPFSERQKIMTLFFTHSLVFLLSLTYYFGRAWFDADKREALLKSKQLETEINFLRSQINPHFLMNILNNIYALSYLKDERTPTMLLKLSEMMRYLIYESNQPVVPLHKEIDFFQNYIELQKLKNKNYEQLSLTITGMKPTDKIPPMVLLPFFENIFKHGDLETNPTGNASIAITIKNNQLTLQTSNSKAEAKLTNQPFGFGLINIRHRLQLLYPGNHQLRIEDAEKMFTCTLQISLP